MDDIRKSLVEYRLECANDSLKAAELCFDNHLNREAVNRAYYASFYAIKAVLAIESVDFKRHKDVIAYFNKEYIATEKFDKELGKKLNVLKNEREDDDYSDFIEIDDAEASEQIETAKDIIKSVKNYLNNIMEM